MSNSSSNLQVSRQPLVQSHFDTLIMYNLLISLLSRRSIPVSFRICINLVHLIWSNAFCFLSMKRAHNVSSTSRVHSDPSCTPSSFFSSKSKLTSKYILNYPFNPPPKYPRCYICCNYRYIFNLQGTKIFRNIFTNTSVIYSCKSFRMQWLIN